MENKEIVLLDILGGYNIMETNNPFLIQKYIVYESNILWTSCTQPDVVSFIGSTDSSANIVGSYLPSKPLSYMELEEYVSNEFDKLHAILTLAKRCDAYGIAMNNNNGLVFPNECNATFKNFSNETVEMIRSNIINSNVPYSSQLQYGSQMFDTYSYTDDYLAKHVSINDKKPICQRITDIIQLLNDMENEANAMNTPENIANYPDVYSAIVEQQAENKKTRTELETRLKEIYSAEGSRSGISKLYLDSTVYTSMLWTILAITLLFYIFKKM